MCIVIVEKKHTGQHCGALLSSTKYNNTRCSSHRNASITLGPYVIITLLKNDLQPFKATIKVVAVISLAQPDL